MTRTTAAQVANADRTAAEAMLRDVAFVLAMTQRAKGIDTSAMHARDRAEKAARRPATAKPATV